MKTLWLIYESTCEVCAEQKKSLAKFEKKHPLIHVRRVDLVDVAVGEADWPFPKVAPPENVPALLFDDGHGNRKTLTGHVLTVEGLEAWTEVEE